MTTPATVGKAAQRYQKLLSKRSFYETRGVACARVTQPILFQPDGSNDGTDVVTPWQGLGSIGTNTLASKLLLTLVTDFWRFILTDNFINGDMPKEAVNALQSIFPRIEKAVSSYIEKHSHRSKIYEFFLQLIVVGNALLYIRPDGALRLYKLRNYVVNRDGVGKVLELVIKESVSPLTLSPAVRELVANPEAEEVIVYTWIKVKDEKTYDVYQEIDGSIIEDSIGTYKADKFPWIAARLYNVDGEHYGRSYVESLVGDLNSLELIAQAITETAVSIARTLYGLPPGSTVRKKELQEAKNQEVLTGDLSKVTTLKSEKGGDLSISAKIAEKIEVRVNRAFLMNSSVQQDRERVTSTEIQYVAQELDAVMGGVYSVLAQEFQMPYIKAILANLERDKVLAKLDDGQITPIIITGLGALHRSGELGKMQQFVALMREVDPADPNINRAEYAIKLGIALGLEIKDWTYTEAEILEAQQQSQLSQMGNTALEGAIKNPEIVAQMQQEMGGQEPAPVM